MEHSRTGASQTDWDCAGVRPLLCLFCCSRLPKRCSPPCFPVPCSCLPPGHSAQNPAYAACPVPVEGDSASFHDRFLGLNKTQG
jgi:hypothetical protein